MQYRKVRSGDDLVIPAEIWNAMLGVIGDDRGNDAGGPKPAPASRALPYAGDVAQIKNATVDNVDRFRAMMIDSVLTTPAVYEKEFLRRPAFKGIKPTAATAGRWGVLIDGLPAGKIGRVLMLGVVPCWINLSSAGDTTVTTAAGSYIPIGGSSGEAQILWVAGGVGTATATGLQWAMIRLGGGAASNDRGQYQGQLEGMVTQNNKGWTYVFAHELL